MNEARLSIQGLVGSPLKLGFQELSKLGHQVNDISEIAPGRQGGAVRLKAIFDAAGASEQATYATFESTDGFSASIPVEGLGEALVLYRQGEEALPADKGGPLRFLIPDAATCRTAEIDACANVKHLGSITLTEGRVDDTRPKMDDPHRKQTSE